MSGWIKVEKSLESDPRTLRIARELSKTLTMFSGPTEDDGRFDPCNALAYHHVTLVCGALARLWMYADTHIRDDDTLDMGAAEIDQWLGIPNFCSTLPDDWLIEIDESTVELPGFQSHNGVDAKKKALTAKRVERHRKGARNGPALQVKEPCNAPALPDQTRPDQTKPDHKNKEGAASPAPVGLDLPAWERWVEYRKAIRKPLKPVSIPAAQRELAAFGAEQAAVVEQSVANGWQGLFALKPKSANGKPQERRIETPPTQDQVEAARRKAAEQNLLNARLAGVLKQVSA